MKSQLPILSKSISGLIVVLGVFALFVPVSASPGRGMISPAWHDYFWTGLLVSPNLWALLGAFGLALSLMVHAARATYGSRFPFWIILTTAVCHLVSRGCLDYHLARVYLPFRPYGDLWTRLVFAGAIASCISFFAQLFIVFSLARTRMRQSPDSRPELTISAKQVGAFLAAAAGIIAVLQWWHIGYRFNEFRTFYHSALGVNHIDDSRFLFIHFFNLFLFGLGVFAVWLVRERQLRDKLIIVGPFVANLIGWATIAVMRHTGVLVPLSEFTKNWKGS